LRIGLVGCGRIGRCLVRLLHRHPTLGERLELVAIEEVAAPEAVEYLLRFDSLLGRFPGTLRRVDGALEIDGRRVALFAPPAAGWAPWRELGVEVVVEAAGQERARAALVRHLEAGARRVLLCAPPLDPPDATIVAGVNDAALAPGHRIVSAGSVTSACAGPVLKTLHRALGVERAFLAAVHAYTSQLALADVPTPDMRSGRAAAENIVPQPTNADELLSELLPELAGRISGLALHVPVPNGSVADLTCWHPRPVTVEEINAALRAACAGELAGIVAYEDQPIVSSDILHTPYSGVFDSLSTMVVAGRVSKTLTFYDNAWGYSNRVVELVGRLAGLDAGGAAA
jgi:glyceraldehyde 3-phosphate dehydrogenase